MFLSVCQMPKLCNLDFNMDLPSAVINTICICVIIVPFHSSQKWYTCFEGSIISSVCIKKIMCQRPLSLHTHVALDYTAIVTSLQAFQLSQGKTAPFRPDGWVGK